MRTLIYKRTHSNDPDPDTGVFGNRDCMGRVRSWDFDAVIGIGGIGQQAKRNSIAGKLTWIGVGRCNLPDAAPPEYRGPQLIFQHFWYRGEEGPSLENYPTLASYMYDGERRLFVHPTDYTRPDLDREIEEILRLAVTAAPSNRSVGPDFFDSNHRHDRQVRPAQSSTRHKRLRQRNCR
jgi:hypothetical protein